MGNNGGGPNENTPRCGANLAGGRTCRNVAGMGTDHLGFGKCKRHLGCVEQVAKAAYKEMAADYVNSAPIMLHEPIELHPIDAIMEVIKRRAGFIRWLEHKIEAEGEHGLHQEALTTGIKSPSVWVKLLNDEQVELVKASAIALNAGVAERQVRLAEQQGQLIFVALKAALDQLGLTDTQQAMVSAVMRRVLTQVASETVIDV
jgi:hypothetical protein